MYAPTFLFLKTFMVLAPFPTKLFLSTHGTTDIGTCQYVAGVLVTDGTTNNRLSIDLFLDNLVVIVHTYVRTKQASKQQKQTNKQTSKQRYVRRDAST